MLGWYWSVSGATREEAGRYLYAAAKDLSRRGRIFDAPLPHCRLTAERLLVVCGAHATDSLLTVMVPSSLLLGRLLGGSNLR